MATVEIDGIKCKECRTIDAAVEIYEEMRKEKTKQGKITMLYAALMKYHAKTGCHCGCLKR